MSHWVWKLGLPTARSLCVDPSAVLAQFHSFLLQTSSIPFVPQEAKGVSPSGCSLTNPEEDTGWPGLRLMSIPEAGAMESYSPWLYLPQVCRVWSALPKVEKSTKRQVNGWGHSVHNTMPKLLFWFLDPLLMGV